MQIWTPGRLESPQQSQEQPGEPSKFCKGSIAPSTAQSLTKSLTTSWKSHFSSMTEGSAIENSFEMPGQPILVLYLTADGEEDNEMSFLRIESKLRNNRSGEA